MCFFLEIPFQGINFASTFTKYTNICICLLKHYYVKQRLNKNKLNIHQCGNDFIHNNILGNIPAAIGNEVNPCIELEQ